jgi:hypothetical protein
VVDKDREESLAVEDEKAVRNISYDLFTFVLKPVCFCLEIIGIFRDYDEFAIGFGQNLLYFRLYVGYQRNYFLFRG